MGKLAEIKTKQTEQNVEDYINKIEDETKRKDSFTLIEMMKKATNEEPKIWGTSIIGFGFKRYKSPATDREVDWFSHWFCTSKSKPYYLSAKYERPRGSITKTWQTQNWWWLFVY